MNQEKQISIAVVKRLPRYYRYLGHLLNNGVSRISSKELSKLMNITASQIRQDLNNFGCFGQQGYGYNVEVLYNEIMKILGLDCKYNMVILGAGNIGQALANYPDFNKNGFSVIGIFDNSPDIIGREVANLIVKNISDLEAFIDENKVDIVVLAIRNDNIEKVAEKVSEMNIRGIWNFSAIDLPTTGNVMIENVHLTDNLMTLSYRIGNRENHHEF